MATAQQHNILKERMADLAGLSTTTREWKPATRFETRPPLDNPSADDLAFAFAENLFDLFRAMAHLPDARIEETAGASRHCAFPFNPMFKGVWQTRLSDADADAAIDDALAWFRAQQAPFAFWWVDSRATPADLGARLAAKGFVAWETDAPGMAADLSQLKYDLIDATPAGYAQEPVGDERSLRDFAAAFVAGNEIPDWAGKAWIDATLAFGIEAAPWRMYVGRMNGKPVASNIMFNGAGVASVFGVATVPEARGRGIGAAITLAAYRDARALGYRHGVLFATELGAPVYRRIGFRDTGVSISRYLWRSE